MKLHTPTTYKATVMTMNVHSAVHVGPNVSLPMTSIFLHATDSCTDMQLTHVYDATELQLMCVSSTCLQQGLHDPLHLHADDSHEQSLEGELLHDVVHGRMRDGKWQWQSAHATVNAHSSILHITNK